MIELPQFVRRMPFVFYALAVIFFVWYLANAWLGISSAFGYGTPGIEEIENYQKSISLFGAFQEAAYMVANGAIIHVLIAIHDKMKGPQA